MFEFLGEIGIISILLAGVVTTLLPCTYPIVLGYVALIVFQKEGEVVDLKKIIINTIAFFLGFTLVYILLGSLGALFGQFSSISQFINSNRYAFQIIIGIVFLIIGFTCFGKSVLPKFLQKSNNFKIPKWVNINSPQGSFLVGLFFAITWSPCIGPVLGGILTLSTTLDSVFTGALLFFVFSLGMMIPMIIFAIIYYNAKEKISSVSKIIPYVRYIAGTLFILLGIIFLFSLNSIFYNFSLIENLPEFLTTYI